MQQSYARILTLGFLLGMRLITSMKSMSQSKKSAVEEKLNQAIEMNRESVSSWSELGLGGDDLNLQVIESSLMSMVKEGTSPSLKPGIEAIYNLTHDMQAAIVAHSTIEQTKLTDSWAALQTCTAEDSQGQADFNALKTVLTECQTSISSYWICVDDCSEGCVTVNEEEEMRRKIECNREPYDCTMQVQGLDNNTHVIAHIENLRTYFRSIAVQTNPIDCTKNSSNGTDCKECETICTQTHNVSTTCNDDVCKFEQTGCGVQHDACKSYEECYDLRAEDYNSALQAVQHEDEAMQNEYRAVLRIQCLLNAFLVSIEDAHGTGLDVGIDYCIHRTYHQYYCKCNTCPLDTLQDVMWNPFLETPANHDSVCSNLYKSGASPSGCENCAQPYIPIFITYPSATGAPSRKSCSEANFPNLEPSFNIVVGSTDWDQKYYTQWPAQAPLPNCTVQLQNCSH